MRALAAAALVIGLAACGQAPAPRATSRSSDPARLRAVCGAFDQSVGRLRPATGGGPPVLVVGDERCEWHLPATNPVPEFVVGRLAATNGSSVLDETESVLKGERAVEGVSDRAADDPQTNTLYVVHGDELWYLQGLARTPSPPTVDGLESIGIVGPTARQLIDALNAPRAALR